jgi:hypothetical protein
MSSLTGPLEPVGVPLEQFMALTKIPIVMYFGDNIPEEPSSNPGQDNWRVRLAMARLWRDAVNRHGGDVTVVHLPELGIRGNTHFAFSDTNNVEIANLLSRFLAEKERSSRAPHQLLADPLHDPQAHDVLQHAIATARLRLHTTGNRRPPARS